MVKSSVIRGGLRTTLALASALVATQAMAQGTTTTAAPASAAPANTSVSTNAQSDKSWIEKLKITYIGILDGPPISALDSKYRTSSTIGKQSDEDGAIAAGYADPSQPLTLHHTLRAMYPINDHVSVGPSFNFDSRVVDSGDKTTGLVDPYIAISDSKFISDGNFSMPTQLRFGLPWSDKSQANKMRTYVRAQGVPTYAIPDTRFELSSMWLGRVKFYQGSSTKEDVFAGLYPAVAYQLLPTLGASVTYNLESHHFQGQGFGNWDNLGTSIQPGLSWDVLPTVNVAPSVFFQTGTRLAPDTTVSEIDVIWKIM